MSRSVFQRELVNLADQIDTEAVVRLLLDELEPARQVDASRRAERMVRPQLQPRVARSTRELDALVDERTADAGTASRRVDEKDPKLRGRVFDAYAEDAPDSGAFALGEPRRFSRR